jgi:hypothetical protein
MALYNAETDSVHDLTTLSGVINKQPMLKKQLTKKLEGLIAAEGVVGKTALIDKIEGKLGIIDPSEHGSAPTRVDTDDFTQLAVAIPHYASEVVVRAEEVSGRRQIGTVDTLETVPGLLERKLGKNRQVFDAIFDFQLDGALRGQIKNSKGKVIADLSQFGATTKFNIDLNSADFDPHAYFRKYKREVAPHLTNYAGDGYIAFIPPAEYEKIVTKKSVKEAYDRWQDGAFFRQDNGERGGFVVADNVELVEFTPDQLAGGLTYGAVNDIIVVPKAQGLIRRFHGPRQDLDYVNTIGLPIYAYSEELPGRRGERIETETNTITLVEVLEAIGILTVGAGGVQPGA